MTLTAEIIEGNFNKFRALCERLDDRAPPVIAMVDELGERLALAPASHRLDFHNAFPGGLVDHSLRVLMNANVYAKSNNIDVQKESLILTCLFHDLGKVGSMTLDYYVPQTSDWHRDKLGEMYMLNADLQFMRVQHRSLCSLQHYGVRLSQEEFLAILLHDGYGVDENKGYSMKEPWLANVLQVADFLATKQEKDIYRATK